MEPQQLRDLSHRTDVIARALLAEEMHLQTEQEIHLTQAMKTHLIEQITFYQKIVDKLREALITYET